MFNLIWSRTWIQIKKYVPIPQYFILNIKQFGICFSHMVLSTEDCYLLIIDWYQRLTSTKCTSKNSHFISRDVKLKLESNMERKSYWNILKSLRWCDSTRTCMHNGTGTGNRINSALWQIFNFVLPDVVS